MSVYRRHKRTDFSVIDNHVFKDKDLSLKAKGLLATILSLPDDWKYSIEGLTSLSNDGTTSVTSALNELIQRGYIIRSQSNDEYGRFNGYIYDIYEKPQEPCSENPITDDTITENQQVLNTNISNTKVLNTKELDISPISPTKKPNRFVPPTLDDIKAYCQERNSCVDPQTFFDYFTTGGWKDSEGKPVKNWKQKLITWEKHSTQHRSYDVPSGNIFAQLREQERGNRL